MNKNSLCVTLVICVLSALAFQAQARLSDYSDVVTLLSDGRLDEAESELNKAIKNNDKDVRAMALRGEVARRKGENSKSLKFLNKAIAADPDYPEAYLYKGKTLFAMQKFDEMSAQFDMYVCRTDQNLNDGTTKRIYISNLHEICGIYFGLKMRENIKRVLDVILKLSPNDQAAIYNLGIYYYEYERDRSAAYGSFKKVIEADPDSMIASKAKYAIEFMRENPDPRVAPNFSFLDEEYRD